MDDEFSIASFYSFSRVIEDVQIKDEIKSFCISNKIRGSIVIAKEGINGTVAGHPDAIQRLEKLLRDIGFNKLNIKFSRSVAMPFYRMKVKIKSEIISMVGESIDPDQERGEMVHYSEWNQIISGKDVLLIDSRNRYETKLGTFKGAVTPDIDSFTEFKEYIDSELAPYKNKTVAMFCTGGVRCEKATYYMKKQGFTDVVQLDGGILRYLENTSEKDSQWTGECFVFDGRVTVNHNLSRGEYTLCRGCNTPLSLDDRQSDKYEKDVSCEYCFDLTTDQKKIGARERSKQIMLSSLRGESSSFLPGALSDYTP
jgi:UPF0176 protein